MDFVLKWLEDSKHAEQVFISVVIVVSVIAFRFGATAALRRSRFRSERLRFRWLGATRRTSDVVFLVGLFIIWGPEIRTFALSIAALAAGLAVAFREVLLCISGFLVNAAGDGYSIGDRVRIDTIHGDVVDLGLFATTILEVDDDDRRTGHLVYVPNSALLTKSVVNETAEGEYVSHSFVLPPIAAADWRRAEAALRQAADEVTKEYLEAARAALEYASHRSGLPFPDAALETTAAPSADARISLSLRVPVPARRRGRIVRRIERRYLELFHDLPPEPETT